MKRKKFLAVLCIAVTAVLLSLPSIFPALADGGLFGRTGGISPSRDRRGHLLS